MAGAPLGNKNGSKGRPWAEALAKSLKQYQGDGVVRGEAMRKIADKVVEAALKGDKDAIREIGDRSDGKPSQAIVGDANAPPIAVSHNVNFIKPNGC